MDSTLVIAISLVIRMDCNPQAHNRQISATITSTVTSIGTLFHYYRHHPLSTFHKSEASVFRHPPRFSSHIIHTQQYLASLVAKYDITNDQHTVPKINRHQETSDKYIQRPPSNHTTTRATATPGRILTRNTFSDRNTHTNTTFTLSASQASIPAQLSFILAPNNQNAFHPPLRLLPHNSTTIKPQQRERSPKNPQSILESRSNSSSNNNQNNQNTTNNNKSDVSPANNQKN